MGAPGCPTPSKKGYKSRQAADRHLWGLLKKPARERRDWQTLHVYKCPCGMFHVGHGFHGAIVNAEQQPRRKGSR